MSECIFCRIVAGDLPSDEVYRDDSAVAFLDLSPQAAGHTLVVPTRHVTDLTSDGDALTEIAPAVSLVASALVADLGAAGVNAVINSGAAAGQEVFHLHVHLIPRGVADLESTDRQAVLARLSSTRRSGA